MSWERNWASDPVNAYDAAGQMTNVTYPAGTTSVSLTYDEFGCMTERIDGIWYSYYSYRMPGGGIKTTAEDGPWGSDAVVVTNKVGRSIGLNVLQPTGSWWQAWDYDSAGRWQTAASPAGTFTHRYPGDATTEPIGVDLPGGNWITNRYDARGRLTETALRGSGGTLLNLHGYAYDAASQRTRLSRNHSVITAWSGHTDTACDAAGQLTKAWSYYTNANPVTSKAWGFTRAALSKYGRAREMEIPISRSRPRSDPVRRAGIPDQRGQSGA